MKHILIRLHLSLFGALLAQQAVAHSAMFPDQFRYDNSNEGLRMPQSNNEAAKSFSSIRRMETCAAGLAGDYPCRNIDLRSVFSSAELGAAGNELNDIWGWTDLATGTEVAIVGLQNGTSFVDISDPVEPRLLGFLPSHDNGSDDWRDIKVYQDHAFIVADGQGNSTHGLQVFDLRTLSTVTAGSTLTETAHLAGFGAAHNVAINEDSGFAYVVGATQCSGGLYMVDVSTPAAPQFAGCYSGDGYTHDVQCVNYQGPDSPFFGEEVCVAYNEDTITIVNVSDKNNPQLLSRTPYNGSQYTHQGWFVDDNHSLLIMNDELDEQRTGINTTSHIWDVSSLTAPIETGRFVNSTRSIDHNLYAVGDLAYESNYRSGLRILDTTDAAAGNLTEVGYFDTIPCSDSAQFSGAWSSYPYFASGNVVVSDIGAGLFVLTPDMAAISAASNPGPPAVSPACGGPSPDPDPDPDPPVPGGNGNTNTPTTDGGGGGGSTPLHAVVMLLTLLGLRKRLSI
ncbi:MAG: choice-of-anchor B family protein [Pseudomonadota bacterium]